MCVCVRARVCVCVCACAAAPLLRVKITTLAMGGTAVGILFQHRVLDADAAITFMRNWARVFCALDIDPPPLHDRCIVNSLDSGELSPDSVTVFSSGKMKMEALERGAAPVPAFAPVMPKISGDEVCVVPFPRTTCEALKAAAAEGLPEGSWVSSDDVVLAHVWKAMCEMRCSQLGLPLDSRETTTCVRCAPSRRRCFECGSMVAFFVGDTSLFSLAQGMQHPQAHPPPPRRRVLRKWCRSGVHRAVCERADILLSLRSCSG
jgi:hypothetical protein